VLSLLADAAYPRRNYLAYHPPYSIFISKNTSLNFTVFLSLLEHGMLSILLILAVYRTLVTMKLVHMTSLATGLSVDWW